MPIFQAINPATGEVEGFLSAASVPSDESNRFYRATDKTSTVWPTPPNRFSKYKYNFSTGVNYWVDTRSLAEAKALKRGEINQARLTANTRSFTFAGKEISCSQVSRSDMDGINGAVFLLGTLPPDWVGGWKAVDNTYVAIPDVPTWKAFFLAMVSQGTLNFAASQNKKAQVDAATTLAEVDAVNSYI